VFAVSGERGGGIKGIGGVHAVTNPYMFYDNLRAQHDLRPLWAQEISEKAWSTWHSREHERSDDEKDEIIEQPASVCVCVTLCETLTRLYAELRLRVARMRRRRYKYMELKKFQ
jgi:hypothetical protein